MFLPIKPIQLLKGSHPDTGQTGSGCFLAAAMTAEAAKRTAAEAAVGGG